MVIGVNEYAGEYGKADTITQMRMLHDQYGDIVKLDGVGVRRPTIFLFSPELCEKMYRMEGVWPSRIAMETLHYYRTKRKHIYNEQYGLATRSVKCFGRNAIIKKERKLSPFFLRNHESLSPTVFLYNFRSHDNEDFFKKNS